MDSVWKEERVLRRRKNNNAFVVREEMALLLVAYLASRLNGWQRCRTWVKYNVISINHSSTYPRALFVLRRLRQTVRNVLSNTFYSNSPNAIPEAVIPPEPFIGLKNANKTFPPNRKSSMKGPIVHSLTELLQWPRHSFYSVQFHSPNYHILL